MVTIPFYDGDDFHPWENIKKMQQGIAFTDDDRSPWLDTLIESVPRRAVKIIS